VTISYRPSNGAEGDRFIEKYCENCIHEDFENEKFCPILSRSYGGQVKAWICDDDYSNARCTHFNHKEIIK
jgi:hypothetical protein